MRAGHLVRVSEHHDPRGAGLPGEGLRDRASPQHRLRDFTPESLEENWTSQLAEFTAQLPGLAAPRTNRTHCIAWSDWAGEPKAELQHGVRLDTNYYYWPEAWVQNRPGMFTGSGFPMRFADTDGSLIDVYQAATQLTDESGIDIPMHIQALLDSALGAGRLLRRLHRQHAHGQPGARGRRRHRRRGAARAACPSCRPSRCSPGSMAATTPPSRG